MRLLRAVPLLLAVGCHTPCPGGLPCGDVCPPPPCPAPVAVQAPPPKVEVRMPPETRVQLPPQKIVVEAPPPPPAAAPAPPVAPMMAPAQFSSFSVQSVPSSRALPAVGLDWVRVPLPILRLYAVPTTPEVTVSLPLAQAPVFAAPVAMVPQAPACPPPAAPMSYPMAAPCPAPDAQQAALAQRAAQLQQTVEDLHRKLDALERQERRQAAPQVPPPPPPCPPISSAPSRLAPR